MSLSARSVAVLATLLALSGLLLALLFGSGERAGAQGASPSVNSDNVTSVASLPGSIAISGVFSRSAPYFYVSGLDAVRVIDVSDPRKPEEVGVLQNAVFENEAMTLGERKLPDGSIQRFVLIGNDLYQADSDIPSGIERGFGIGGQELIVVEVTDPENPQIVGRTPLSEAQGGATTGTHTVACMNAACTVAYSSGSRDGFSIFDLTDLTKPRQVKQVPSPAGTANANAGGIASGHHWQVDGQGIAWHAGSAGTVAFDISDPLNPQPLNGTDANGQKTPYNDFIHHNSQRPNSRAFAPGKAPSVVNGNVALITEEDYVNDGDELACDRAGTFQTWEVPTLDGGAYRAANPKLEANKGSMRPLDIINAPNEAGTGGVPTPAGGFCSAHWFDYHQSGTVAIGHYQAGLRLIDVRDAKDLKQAGFAFGGASEVWDAYWVPQRNPDGSVRSGYKENLIYTVDAVRGVDVYEVSDLPPDLPVTGDEGGRGTFPAAPATVAAAQQNRAGVTRCGAPTSTFTRGSRITRKGLRLRGTATGAGCSVAKVRVAIGRKVGSKCRFLRADGRFGPRRSCLRTQYLTARGTSRWTLNRRVRLPRGAYMVWSRAIDTEGTIERKARARNHIARRVGPRR